MKRFLNLFVLIAFCFSSLNSYPVFAAPVNLPQPGTMLTKSEQFAPVTLRGLKFDRQNPFKLSFILDEGNTKLTDTQLKETSRTLIRYFLAALTTPGQDMWVNLSPYEQDRILPESFAATDLGNDMLAQDYLLKQLASSLTYPETELGKRYWDEINNSDPSTLPRDSSASLRVRSATNSRGALDAGVRPSFTKVWITPNETQVYETGEKVFITKSSLKILSDQDYLAMQQNNISVGARHASPAITGGASPSPTAQTIDPFKTLIIPAIEKEVNTGKNFSGFRQLHSAIILAAWFKNRLKDSIYDALYIDKGKTAGIKANDPQAKEKIFAQYVEAFKKGAYNYVKTTNGDGSLARMADGKRTVPIFGYKITKRAYFSGGVAEPIANADNLIVTTTPSTVCAPGKLETVPADAPAAEAAVAVVQQGALTQAGATLKQEDGSKPAASDALDNALSGGYWEGDFWLGADGSRMVTAEEKAQKHEELRINNILAMIKETLNKSVSALPYDNYGELDFRWFFANRKSVKLKVPGTEDKYEDVYDLDLGSNLGGITELLQSMGIDAGTLEAKALRVTLRLTYDGILVIESPLFGGGHAGLNRMAVYGRNRQEIEHELYELRKLQKFAQYLNEKGFVHYAPGVPLGDCLRNWVRNLNATVVPGEQSIEKITLALLEFLKVEPISRRPIEISMLRAKGNLGDVAMGIVLEEIHKQAQKYHPVSSEPQGDAKDIFVSSGAADALVGYSPDEQRVVQAWQWMCDHWPSHLKGNEDKFIDMLFSVFRAQYPAGYELIAREVHRYFIADVTQVTNVDTAIQAAAIDALRPFLKDKLQKLQYPEAIALKMNQALEKAIIYQRTAAAYREYYRGTNRTPYVPQLEAIAAVHAYNPRGEKFTKGPNENGDFAPDSGFSRLTIMEKIEMLTCGRALTVEEREGVADKDGKIIDEAKYLQLLGTKRVAGAVVFPYELAKLIVKKGAAGSAGKDDTRAMMAALAARDKAKRIVQALWAQGGLQHSPEKILTIVKTLYDYQLSLTDLGESLEKMRDKPAFWLIVKNLFTIHPESELTSDDIDRLLAHIFVYSSQELNNGIDKGLLAILNGSHAQELSTAIFNDIVEWQLPYPGIMAQAVRVNPRLYAKLWQMLEKTSGWQDVTDWRKEKLPDFHGPTMHMYRDAARDRNEYREAMEGVLTKYENYLDVMCTILLSDAATPEQIAKAGSKIEFLMAAFKSLPHFNGDYQRLADVSRLRENIPQVIGKVMAHMEPKAAAALRKTIETASRERQKDVELVIPDKTARAIFAAYKAAKAQKPATRSGSSDGVDGLIQKALDLYDQNPDDPGQRRRVASMIVGALNAKEESSYVALNNAERAVGILENAGAWDISLPIGQLYLQIAQHWVNGDISRESTGPAAFARYKEASRKAIAIDQKAGYGGINETGLTVETKGDGRRIPLFKNVPLRAENFPGFDFTIDAIKRNQTAAQAVL